MNRLLRFVLLALASVNVAQAQEDRALAKQSTANIAADFANTSAGAPSWKLSNDVWGLTAESGSASNLSFAGTGLPGSAPSPPKAVPAAPEPKFVYGSRDDYRWQLALGISLVRFRSQFYYATGVGTNTSLAYFTNEWLGVEGNVNTSFAPTVYLNAHVKYVSYGFGPKIAWRARKIEPWAHALVGGTHILPQVAGHGQNGLALQVGGGADYRIYPHLSARLEVDWIRTQLFDASQNNAQANLDIVLHF